MPPSLIGKVSQRLRSLVRSGEASTTSHEAEIATLGLIERIRDERRCRESVAIDKRFGLIGLLETLALDSPTAAATFPAHAEKSVVSGTRHNLTKTFDPAFLARQRYVLAELIGSSNAVFLELAYRCVLKRAPDPTGAQQLMTGMQTGTLDRIDVLHALNASYEGRDHGVKIVGLHWRWLWRRAERVRFAGFVVAWLRAMMTARTTARRLNALEARIESFDEQSANDIVGAEPDTEGSTLHDQFRRLQVELRIERSIAAAGASASADRLQRLEESLDHERARVDELLAVIADIRSTDQQSLSS